MYTGKWQADDDVDACMDDMVVLGLQALEATSGEVEGFHPHGKKGAGW